MLLLFLPAAAAPAQEPYEGSDMLLQLRLLLLEEQYGQMIGLAESVAVPDSLQDEVWYLQGRAYQSLFQYDKAYECYARASRLVPGAPAYRVSMGMMLAKLGRTAEAIQLYEKLRMDSLARPQHAADLAGLYAQRDRWDLSLEIYNELLKKDSLNYYYLKQAGRASLELHHPDSALGFFKHAFRVNPADPYLTHQIANIYLKRKDMENALFNLQKGFVYDTSNPDLLKLRGYIWVLLNEYDMASYDLEAARQQDSNSVFIEKYLGLSYHEVKKYEEASVALRKAFALDSTDSETAFFLASALRWSRHEEEGVYWYNKSIELMQPDSGDMKNTYLQLAELYKVLHRFDEALESYNLGLSYDPDDNVVYFKIAQLYDRNLDRKKTAIEYYEKFLNKGRTDMQLYNREEQRMSPLEPHVKQRISELKEELFFEGEQK